jgi:hypothetical protein
MTVYLLGIAGYAAAVFVVANALEKIFKHRKAPLDAPHQTSVSRHQDKHVPVGSD